MPRCRDPKSLDEKLLGSLYTAVRASLLLNTPKSRSRRYNLGSLSNTSRAYMYLPNYEVHKSCDPPDFRQ